MSDTPEGYLVEIVEDATGAVVKSLTAPSKRAAERLESGVMRNLNHNKYFTRIVPAAAAIGETTKEGKNV